MADAVATRTLLDDDRQIGVYLTSVGDGTGEAAVGKIVLANVAKCYDPVTRLKIVPVALDLAYIAWNIAGFTSVSLLWKAASNDKIISLVSPSTGWLDFTGHNVLIGDTITSACAQDPISGTHVGDILLTSAGASGSTYNIVAWFRKRVA